MGSSEVRSSRGRANLTLRTADEDLSRSPPHSADVPAAETVGRTWCPRRERNRSHGSLGSVEVLLEMPAQSTERGPFQAPPLLCEGPGASPWPQPVVRRWPSGRRAQGYRSGGPPSQARRQRGHPSAGVGAARRCPGSGFAARLQGSVPRLGSYSHHPRPPAAVVAQDPRSSAEDLHPRAGAFVPLTDPLHHSEQRESPRPSPASYQLRSYA